jgi:hypothetical protein
MSSPATGLKLLIISRDLLLIADSAPDAPLIYRHLATLNRRGCSLLLTAPEPDQWVPTRGNVDNALQSQARLRDRIQQAGGDLDGIYYVPRSLLTQDRNRLGALQDILSRYGLGSSQALLLSNSVPFIKAAARLGIQAQAVAVDDRDCSDLLAQLTNI